MQQVRLNCTALLKVPAMLQPHVLAHALLYFIKNPDINRPSLKVDHPVNAIQLAWQQRKEPKRPKLHVELCSGCSYKHKRVADGEGAIVLYRVCPYCRSGAPKLHVRMTMFFTNYGGYVDDLLGDI